MLVTIVKVEQEFTRNGDEYKKVTVAKGDGAETTKSVFNNLEDKWPLLKAGSTLEFVMEKRGQYWNVTDIKTVEEQLPPPQENKSEPLPDDVQKSVQNNVQKTDTKYKADPDKTSSIEEQVAFKGIIDLRCSDKIEADSITYNMALYWAREKMGIKAEDVIDLMNRQKKE